MVLVAFALLIPACGEGGRRIPSTQSVGPGPRGGGISTAEVSWTRDVWPILTVRCRLCHTSGSGADQVPGMPMTDAVTLYESWVRVPSQCNPNLFRVYPGRSDLSFVFDKISETAPLCGRRMPLDGAPLDDAEQQSIRSWIDQGASLD